MGNMMLRCRLDSTASDAAELEEGGVQDMADIPSRTTHANKIRRKNQCNQRTCKLDAVPRHFYFPPSLSSFGPASRPSRCRTGVHECFSHSPLPWCSQLRAPRGAAGRQLEEG